MRDLYTSAFLVARLLAALSAAYGLLAVITGTIRLFTYEWYYAHQEPVSLMHLTSFFWSDSMWLILGIMLWLSSAWFARRLCPEPSPASPRAVAVLVFRSATLVVGFLITCSWATQIAREVISMIESHEPVAYIGRTVLMRSQSFGLYFCATILFWFIAPWFARFATREVTNVT